MLPVIKSNVFIDKKTGFPINSGHETAAAIENFDESNNGVFLQFFLS